MTMDTDNVPATHASEDDIQAFFESVLNAAPHLPPSDEELARRSDEESECVPRDEGRFDYWAACTECGGRDGWRNIGRTHWCYCDIHRQKWSVGWNLTSEWRVEDETKWEQNAAYLADYLDVTTR
jgi:hypothetical protein